MNAGPGYLKFTESKLSADVLWLISLLTSPVAPGEQPPRCGVVGNTEAGKMTCELSKGHEGYHSQGTVYWLGYFPPPAPRAPLKLTAKEPKGAAKSKKNAH